MAGLLFTAQTGPILLTAGVTQTILQVTAPTNQRVKITRFALSFDGVISTALPATLAVYRQTTAGVMTASPPPLVLLKKGYAETIQTTVAWKATTEPTYAELLIERYISVYNGSFDRVFNFSQELEIPGGGRLGFVLTCATAPNVCIGLDCEE